MGYLTTLTIYNDGLDLITKDVQELNQKIFDAINYGETADVGHKGFCNLIRVQKHAMQIIIQFMFTWVIV